MEIQSRAPEEHVKLAPLGLSAELRLAYDWNNVNEAANGRRWRVTKHTDRGLVFLSSEGKNYWVYASHIEISFEDGAPGKRLDFDNPPRFVKEGMSFVQGGYIILKGEYSPAGAIASGVGLRPSPPIEGGY